MDTFKFVQAQNFSLAGGGAIAGATSITLKSFAGIDGALLTMTDFGTKGFMTLEPGNGALEEQISFTGVTQNANGTATLTGISNVTFISPYTATSGLAKTHAGSTTAIVSNTSGFYDRFTAKGDDETVTGLWDFPSGGNNPTIGAGVYAAPTLDTQIATKKYVDTTAVSGAPNANTTTKGIVQIATQSDVDSKTAVGSTGATLVPQPALARSTLLSDFVPDTGAANAYVITPIPAVSAYAAGQRFTFSVTNTNTTTSTLNVSGLGAITIKKQDGTVVLAAGDLVAGQVAEVEYSTTGGAHFQLMTPVGNVPVSLVAGAYPAGIGTAITLIPKQVYSTTTPVTDSTNAEITLITFSLSGGLLSTASNIRGFLHFSNIAFDSGGNTLTIKLKYGATTLVTANSGNLTFSGGTTGVLEFVLFATGATNSQEASLQLNTFGNGDQTANALHIGGVGTAAIDSTSNQTFTITAQWTTNNAASFTMYNASVIYLP